jgi:tetratricopeptide (TPR) repeat protein
MPPRSDSITTALEAIAQGRYSEAIEVLEMYEQLTLNPQSEQYVQIRKGLIEAYYGMGNQKKALWLCQQLTTNKNPDVQAWAQQMTELINKPAQAEETENQQAPEPPKPYLTAEQSEKLLDKGAIAFKGKRYADAIRDLEEFCRGTDFSTKNYFIAQTYLVKAYQANGQMKQAIAFAEQMAASDKEVIQTWGKKFLESSSHPPVAEPTESSDDFLEPNSESTEQVD